jgi:hypothetical protein
MATRTAANHTTGSRPEQLTLLPASDKPIQFRLDRRTRERGLAQIAAIRRQLAQQAESRSWSQGQAA